MSIYITITCGVQDKRGALVLWTDANGRRHICKVRSDNRYLIISPIHDATTWLRGPPTDKNL